MVSSPSPTPAHRDVAVVEDAAENALVDVDALDLVEAHLERAALDEAGLVDDAHIGDVGLGGPAMEPGRDGPVQRHERHHGRSRQAQQDDAFGRWSAATARTARRPRSRPRSPANRRSSARWSNTAPFRRAAGYRRYNAPYASASITRHHASYRNISGPNAQRNPVACRNRAAMYTRLLARALAGFARGSHYST